MKLLSIETTRVTELFHVTRPQGQLPIQKIASEFVDRYQFAGVPQSLEDFSSDHVELSRGIFQEGSIEKLDVYNDGVVVSGRSNTDFFEEFLHDLILWLERDLGMSRLITKDVTRSYESEITVELDPKVLDVLDPLNSIGTKISGMVAENCGKVADYSALGFAFSTEQASAQGLTPGPFRLERRLASEFHFNHFVSGAPLKTQQHIEILESLEAISNQA